MHIAGPKRTPQHNHRTEELLGNQRLCGTRVVSEGARYPSPTVDSVPPPRNHHKSQANLLLPPPHLKRETKDKEKNMKETDHFPLKGRKESTDTENLSVGTDGSSSSTKPLCAHPKLTKDFQSSDDEDVVVLGSGDFGRAIASRLRQAGLGGAVASRDPEKNRRMVEEMGCTIGTYEEILPESRIVVLAVPYECHQDLPARLLSCKILVDVSNRHPEEKAGPKSIAEVLQASLPGSRVVKALNTLSAYSLETGAIQGSKEIPICGDDPEARQAVAQVVRDLGFIPVDSGGLGGTSRLEDQPLRFFTPEWRFAFKLSAGLFAFVWLFFLFRFQLCRGLTDGEWFPERFEWLVLTNTQLSFSVAAITQLTLVYAPGVLAAYLQLWRGTKYSRFPLWLNRWIRSRKQIGLLVLLMGSLHGSLSIIQKLQHAMDFSWVIELQILAGVILWFLLVILGILSLPSVTTSMSWREFSFLHSKIGWLALAMAFAHVALLSGNYIFSVSFRCYILPRGTQLCIILPFLTLLFKIPLITPCIGNPLSKIRRGYERLNTDPSESV
ncbi:metalloreductase STEAP4-like [Oratosquilla oratoria]|uniref:metalloreductase STEAP4-like n=1 Tax=Oratosquilla oratoria TaxID=337810 RepID=UPI003F770197